MAVRAVTRNGEEFMLADFVSPQEVFDAVNSMLGQSLTGSLSAADEVWLGLAGGGALRYSTIERLEVNDE